MQFKCKSLKSLKKSTWSCGLFCVIGLRGLKSPHHWTIIFTPLCAQKQPQTVQWCLPDLRDMQVCNIPTTTEIKCFSAFKLYAVPLSRSANSKIKSYVNLLVLTIAKKLILHFPGQCRYMVYLHDFYCQINSARVGLHPTESVIQLSESIALSFFTAILTWS